MGCPSKAFPRLLLSALLACSLPTIAGAAKRADKQNDQPGQKEKAKQEKKSERQLYKELSPQYKRWLDEDVVYIITPEERRAFLHLQTNESANSLSRRSGSVAIPT